MISARNPSVGALPGLVSILLFSLAVAPPAAAATRGGQAPVEKVNGTGGFTFTTVTDPAVLVQCLLGSEVQVRNAALTAVPGQAGTFLGGAPIVGFDGGVALSTGLITGALGPNSETGQTGTDHLTPGDEGLAALVTPALTYDACVLQFEFFTDRPRQIAFDYVFSSEEYSEFVGAGFNDVFAFFLNGTEAANNIGRVPASCGTTVGIPVSVDNVNCGNLYDLEATAVNCNCYVDNEWRLDPTPVAPPLNTEMDGLTKVFTATGTTVTGWNTLRIAIADVGDEILDSNVFIRCSSFVVPTQPSTWGEVKSLYR